MLSRLAACAPQGRGGALAGAAAALLLALAFVPAAEAAQRFVSPTGSSQNPCTQLSPCDLRTAIERAVAGDEVIVAAGTYGTFDTDIRTDVPITLRGADGQARPLINLTRATLVLFGGTGTTVRDIEITHSSTIGAIAIGGGLAERLVVTSGGYACGVSGDTTLRNSFCRATGTGAGVLMAIGAGGPLPPETATLRNVTAVSATGAGIQVRAGDFMQLTLLATNVIAQGPAGDVQALITGDAGTMSAEVRLDHSNYDTTEVSGGTVTPPGTGTNQTAAPIFRDLTAGDLHQASKSPTIDAGITDAANGTTDVDGQARTQGASTDIGGDEFPVPQTTITAGPSGPTNDATPEFTFSSSEAGSTFQCRVDTAAFAPCSSPHTTAVLSQGTHTFEVRAIDPAGTVDPTPATRTFTVDTTAPQTTITAGPSGPTSDATPEFTFSSSEAGSTFQCRVDTAAFAPCSSPHTTAALSQGPHTFEVRAIDPAGNVDATPASRSFVVDVAAPETTITAGPSGPTNDATPTFSFSSGEAGSTFECRIDTAAFAPCSSPHTTAALGQGVHRFEVRAVDSAGTADPTPASRSFTIDTVPPQTLITGGPLGSTADETPTFEFNSTEPGSRFECSIDGGPFFPCSSPFTTPPMSRGAHTFAVRAVDRAGNVDPSSATAFDESGARRTFTVIAAPPPPPVFAKTFNAEPVGPGEVFVSLPAGAARASASVPGLKGRKFIPLREARQLPIGTIFDTRRGGVRLTSARDSKGAVQSGDFSAGVFQVLQSRRRRDKGFTELRLKGGSFRSCSRGRKGRRSTATAAARKSRRTIRRVRGRGSGRFKSSGNHSSATVRGTEWTTADRCDGTLTSVTRGVVAVRDFRRRKTILVRAGKRYLARARG